MNLTQIVVCKFDCNCADVLFEAMQFRRAWDWDNPRLLTKQPCERYLCGCRLLSFCDCRKQIDHGLIRFPSFRRKPRHDVAEVRLVECSVRVDLSREEASSQRTEWNESNAEFLTCC